MFNSEPNKKLRLTPPLASRGVGIGLEFWIDCVEQVTMIFSHTNKGKNK